MALVKNIVLVHGAWADGSSWNKVIPLLQQAGYRVGSVQPPLTSLEADRAASRRVLNRLEGNTILVGHSYGGIVISGAAVGRSNVVGLVYIAAYASKEGENLVELSHQFPPVPSSPYIRTDSDDYLWVDPNVFPQMFAADVDPAQANLMSVVMKLVARQCFWDTNDQVAWQNLPSWYLVCDDDLMINPVAERWMTERIGATTRSIPTSHAPIVSSPREVADLILVAASSQN